MGYLIEHLHSRSKFQENSWRTLLFLLLVIGLYLSNLYSPSLFHTAVELISVVIAWSLFLIVWNARRWMNNRFMFALGTTLAAAGVLDMFHLLTYKELALFPGYDSNLPTQIWISARSLQSVSILFFLVFLVGKTPFSNKSAGGQQPPRISFEAALLSVYFAIVGVLLLTIFLRKFPLCYVEGQGQTGFKIIFEGFLSAVSLITLGMLWFKRRYFERQLLYLLSISLALTSFSEWTFMFFVNINDFPFLIGHFAKLGAYFLIYIASIEVGLQQPYSLIFRNLTQQISTQKRTERVMLARNRLMELAIHCSLNELLQATLDEVEQLTGSRIGFYHFVSEDQKSLSLQTWSTNTLTHMCKAEGAGMHYPVDQAGVWVDCIRARRPVIHNDYAALAHRKGLPQGHAAIIRELVVPVMRGEKIVAILGTGNKQTDYDTDDVEIVNSLADLAWDFNDRKLADETLRKSEQRLREAQVLGQISDWELDLATGKYTYSEEFYRLFDLDPATGAPPLSQVLEQIHPEDALMLRSHFEQAIANGTGWEQDIRIYPGSGKEKWHHHIAVAVVGQDGKTISLHGTVQDITERKALSQILEERVRQRTAEINEREIQYRSLFEQTHDAVFIMDLSGQHIAVNQRAADMLGYRVEEIKTLSFKNLFAEVDQHNDIFDRILAGEHLPLYEMLFQKKGGQSFPVEINIELIHGQNHEPMLIQCTARDITLRKQGEETLRRANIEMEQAMRLKDEFLASMSHELRTPLTGIMGMAEGLQDLIYGPVTEKQGKALTSIYNSGLHLLDLINDILDVSKLNADKLELTLELCSLNQLCLTSLQMVKELAHKKNQVVHYSIMPNVIELLVDSRRLKQILVNLLSNAIKFTGERKHLGLDVHGDKENQMVILAVWDEGIGIKQEDFEKLFHPFVQLDSRLSRQQTGTGLGLVLVQNLIELHGGSLTIESTYGEGSRFIVRLPWKAASPDDMLLTGDLRALPSDHPTSIPVLTTNLPLIMLVDDDEINIEAISSYMRSKKYRIVTARNGWEFLENVDSIQPDMILMDIQMPGMDGIEAIQRLRMHSEPAIANIPVIAITALAMPGDHEKCLTAGANAYFSKPLHLNELAVAISDLLSNNQKKAS